MTDRVRDDVETRRTPRIPADHGRHDRLLVTRFAGDDAYSDELDLAQALVATCPDCAQLAADIRLLAQATSELPAARRTRDFRLSSEQAEAARGTRFERFLRRLAAPGLAPLRPVAGVALSLGLALAVVGSALPQGASLLDATRQLAPDLPPAERGFQVLEPESGARQPVPGEGEVSAPDPVDHMPAADEPAAGTPQPERPMLAGEEEPVPDAAATPAFGRADYAATPAPDQAYVESETVVEDPEAVGDSLYSTLQTTASEEVARPILIYGGLGMALVSLGVLLLVWFARRWAHDPLLR